MAVLALLARSIWRHRVRSLVALAVVGGIGLGVVMTAVASARRADSAYTRLRQKTLAPDALGDGSSLTDADVARLAATPSIEGVARFSYTPVAPEPLRLNQAAGFVGLDPDFLRAVYRPQVRAGRLPRRDASDEVVVNEALAKAAGYQVGQRITLRVGDNVDDIGKVTIVGITRGVFDVGVTASTPAMLMPSTLLEAHGDAIEIGPEPALIARLSDGAAGVPQFRRALREVVGEKVEVQTGAQEARSSQRTLRVQTYGYALLAAVVLIALGVAVAQALSRVLSSALVDLPTLVSMGFRPEQRVLLGVWLVVPVAVIGAVTAVVVATLASPLIPTGYARTVDPFHGTHLDLLSIVLLGTAWVLGVAAVGAALAWRERPGRSEPRARRVNRVFTGMPLRPRLGGQAAFAPARSPAGVAARSSLAGVAVGLAGIVAVTIFATSLDYAFAHPKVEGWSFDAALSTDPGSADALRTSLSDLRRDPRVAAAASASLVYLKLDGHVVETYAFAPDSTLHPSLRSGHMPQQDGEIALGRDTMRDLGLSIGDRVLAKGLEGRAKLRVVGSAVYPELGNNGDLANAASVTRATAARLGGPPVSALTLIRMQPGEDPSSLQRYAPQDGGVELVTAFHAPRVKNLDELGAIPWLLAGGLGLIALLALGHGLLRSVQTRRHEDAVLLVIGFRPRDVRSIINWQATFGVAIGAVVGAVIGIIGGRVAWSAVAAATGIVNRPVVPIGIIVVAVGAAVLVANVMAFVMARPLARTAPAAALRTE
jgi:ABC-type lipoprotein release transport system permease subunit